MNGSVRTFNLDVNSDTYYRLESKSRKLPMVLFALSGRLLKEFRTPIPPLGQRAL